jgi:hypothetical protein
MTNQDYVLLFAALASAGALWQTVSCLWYSEPPRRALSDYTLAKLRRDSDPNAMLWSGVIRGNSN